MFPAQGPPFFIKGDGTTGQDGASRGRVYHLALIVGCVANKDPFARGRVHLVPPLRRDVDICWATKDPKVRKVLWLAGQCFKGSS